MPVPIPLTSRLNFRDESGVLKKYLKKGSFSKGRKGISYFFTWRYFNMYNGGMVFFRDLNIGILRSEAIFQQP
jgi:hypothetical protein